MFSLIKRLWLHINPRRRWQFLGLQALMLVTTFSELVSIGLVLPFLGALTYPERIFDLPVAKPLLQEFGLTSPSQLILPLTVAFGLAAILACAMRVLLLWTSIRLSYAVGSDLSNSVYHRTLHQSYAVHCTRNSSELITAIIVKSHIAIRTITNILAFVNSSVLLVVILVALLALYPLIALTTFFGFGFIYLVITKLAQKILIRDSQIAAIESTQVTKALQEGLGGIRDILIDGSQATYSNIYKQADYKLRCAQGRHTFISASPRFVMETLGMVLIAAAAYSLAGEPDGLVKAIPVLGVLALSAQRLLPALQSIYASWSDILANQESLKDYLDLLDQASPAYANSRAIERLPFNNAVTLSQLSFRYNKEAPYVLKDINLTIHKGSCIGFIGPTGCGKSTLLDIVMGLLFPTEGVLKIDGHIIDEFNNHAWQTHIAHVPQAIFLADASIEENIAFGIPKNQINIQRVRDAAMQARISETIENFPDQYDTIVGERGIRLSGGQRQRIGIARALYKKANVIIFDEATSALDGETEDVVMQAIGNLSKELTVLIIAHRLTTLKNCDLIVELDSGSVKRIGTYSDVIIDRKLE